MIYSATQENGNTYTVYELDETDEQFFREQIQHYNDFIVRLGLRKGFDQIPRDIMRRTDLTASAKLVYSNIIGRIYKGNTFSIPGIDTIAEDTGTGTATVKRAIAELVGKGLIVRVDRGRRSNRYELPSLLKVVGSK